MPTRPGTLLEKNVAKIFELAGFKVTHQARINGYEIDVLAEKNNIKVVCECKQYEKSMLSIRNLIHLWDSKNKEINADRVIIALFGINPSASDYSLANKYQILIWDEDKISHNLNNLIDDKNNAIPILIEQIGLNNDQRLSINNLKDNVEILSDEEVPLSKQIDLILPDGKIIKNINTKFFDKEAKRVGGNLFSGSVQIRGADYIDIADLPCCIIADGRPKIIKFLMKKPFLHWINLQILILNKKKEVLKFDKDVTLSKGKYPGYYTDMQCNYCIVFSAEKKLPQIKIRDKVIFSEKK